jgi:hypothetical protein
MFRPKADFLPMSYEPLTKNHSFPRKSISIWVLLTLRSRVFFSPFLHVFILFASKFNRKREKLCKNAGLTEPSAYYLNGVLSRNHTNGKKLLFFCCALDLSTIGSGFRHYLFPVFVMTSLPKLGVQICIAAPLIVRFQNSTIFCSVFLHFSFFGNQF